MTEKTPKKEPEKVKDDSPRETVNTAISSHILIKDDTGKILVNKRA